MNVVLIGFRGSGKTTVGRALAERLGREFIDTDDHIERQAAMSIRDLFERHGESHFRTLESQAIAELSKLDGKVIATGGGAVLKYQNMQVFKRAGARTFFLEVGAETARRRIQADAASRQRRPALTDEDPAVEIRKLIEFRRPYYRQAADHVIAADDRKVEEIVEELLKILAEHGVEEKDDQDAAPA
jgi:shikimate kinase